MGNRAVITLEDDTGKTHPIALYVHWNGGLESCLAFVEYTHDTFGFGGLNTFHARLCQVIGNFFQDGYSLVAFPARRADADAKHCDNGRHHFRISKDGVSLPANPEALVRARRHSYWTDSPPIKVSLAKAMPVGTPRREDVLAEAKAPDVAGLPLLAPANDGEETPCNA